MESFTWLDTKLDLPKVSIEEIEAQEWFFVRFQGADMCSIYNIRKDENWIDGWALDSKSPIRRALEDIIFPFLGGEGNVTIIKTTPEEELNDHIDAAANQYGSTQYKFRWVLQGRTDTLYFFDEKEEKHYIDSVDSYIINGAHPHGMKNEGGNNKYTLCVGAPWKCNDIFLSNINTLDKHFLNLPKLKEEWTDPRIEKKLDNVKGITYD